MKQILNLEEIVGKKIVRASDFWLGYFSAILICFDDDTFIAMQPRYDDDGDVVFDSIIHIPPDPRFNEHFYKAGLITNEEYMEIAKLEEEKRQIEEKYEEENERIEYERLKAKFEP
jgi:hypothetical protein